MTRADKDFLKVIFVIIGVTLCFFAVFGLGIGLFLRLVSVMSGL